MTARICYPARENVWIKNADARHSSNQRKSKGRLLHQSEGGKVMVGRRKEQARKQPMYEENVMLVPGRRRDVRKGVVKMCHLGIEGK